MRIGGDPVAWTDICGEGEPFVEDELQGKWLVHHGLGIALAYRYSFRCLVPGDEGRLCRAGEVVARGPGCGLALGVRWSWWAEKMRVVEARW